MIAFVAIGKRHLGLSAARRDLTIAGRLSGSVLPRLVVLGEKGSPEMHSGQGTADEGSPDDCDVGDFLKHDPRPAGGMASLVGKVMGGVAEILQLSGPC
jgi:hypothetical protein